MNNIEQQFNEARSLILDELKRFINVGEMHEDHVELILEHLIAQTNALVVLGRRDHATRLFEYLDIFMFGWIQAVNSYNSDQEMFKLVANDIARMSGRS